jgi:hypothetical protein
MATQYFGDSFYKESLLIRCACKDHMIEIFEYDGSENMEYGITCITPYNKKIKRGKDPNFYFNNITEFKNFVWYMHEIEFSGNFNMTSAYNNGELVVNRDHFGWYDIVRYMTSKDKRKNKPIWDICIAPMDFPKLLKELDLLLNKCFKIEVDKGNAKGEILNYA